MHFPHFFQSKDIFLFFESNSSPDGEISSTGQDIDDHDPDEQIGNQWAAIKK